MILPRQNRYVLLAKEDFIVLFEDICLGEPWEDAGTYTTVYVFKLLNGKGEDVADIGFQCLHGCNTVIDPILALGLTAECLEAYPEKDPEDEDEMLGVIQEIGPDYIKSLKEGTPKTPDTVQAAFRICEVEPNAMIVL